MAHLEKLTKGSLHGLTIHVERKSFKHSNKEIDIEKTHLNYSLLQDNSDAMTRLSNRLENVYMLNRKNVNAACSWVVSLPVELNKNSENDKEKFFTEIHNFMTERYGGIENVLYSEVHNDESTPHLHFAFVPVVWDENKQRNKVSAKDVINRNELKIFHNELDKHLKNVIPGIYKGGILNEKTLPYNDVKDIKMNKQKIAEAEEMGRKMKTALDPVRNEYQAMRDYLNKMNNNSKDDMYPDTVKSSRTLFGKDIVTLPKSQYEDLFLSWYEMRAFDDSKKAFDKRLETYQDKDFWKAYQSVLTENNDLRTEIDGLKREIKDNKSKVWAYEWMEHIYEMAEPFISKHFNIMMSLAERLPVVRDFAMGFIAGSEKYGNLNRSLNTAAECHIEGFDTAKESLNLEVRKHEKEPTQSIDRFRGPRL